MTVGETLDRLSVHEVASWLVTLLTACISYILVARQRRRVAREANLVTLAEVNAKMTVFTALIQEVRAEHTQWREEWRDIAQAASLQVAEAAAQAKAAYSEANAVNKKIAEVGLQFADGSGLGPPK